MKRLHLVTEGHGDVEAAPRLAFRVLSHLGRTERWTVTRRSSRLPKGEIVDRATGAPLANGLAKAAGFATAQHANALLLLIDADDDCPVRFGPLARSILEQRLPAGAVMVVREFETWLALAHGSTGLAKAEAKRDAKSLLRTDLPQYKPTVHQAELARTVDVAKLLASGSKSFEKFVRELDRLTR